MKNYISLLAVATTALVCASCSSNGTEEAAEEAANKDAKVAMSFSFSTGETTRACLDGTQGLVKWNAGDKITIFETTHSSGDTFTCSTADDNIGTFAGNSYKGTSYIAVCPAAANASYNPSANRVTYTVPATQVATEGTFDPSAMVQMGIATGGASGSISMVHASALFYINLEKSDNVKYESVVLTASNYNLVGTIPAEVTSTGVTNYGSEITNGSKTVTLVGNNSGLFTGGYYAISIIPSSAYPTISMVINYHTSADNFATLHQKTANFTGAKQLAAGHMYSLGTYALSDGVLVQTAK